MVVITLARLLGAGQPDLLGVDYDDVITRVEKGSVDGLFFSGQDSGDAARQASEDLSIGIYDVPGALDFRFLDERCRHSLPRPGASETPLWLSPASGRQSVNLTDFSGPVKGKAHAATASGDRARTGPEWGDPHGGANP
jgi:hypothetical protein